VQEHNILPRAIAIAAQNEQKLNSYWRTPTSWRHWDSAIKQETQDKPVLLSLTPEVAPYLNIFNNRNCTSRDIEDNFIVAKVVRFQAIEAFNSPPYIQRLKHVGFTAISVKFNLIVVVPY
jgi:hypothetical protein